MAARLEWLVGRLAQREVQAPGLVASPTVVAREFVVRDVRGMIRARLEMQQFAPSLTFFGPAGKERLMVGLRLDGSPLLRVEPREIPLG